MDTYDLSDVVRIKDDTYDTENGKQALRDALVQISEITTRGSNISYTGLKLFSPNNLSISFTKGDIAEKFSKEDRKRSGWKLPHDEPETVLTAEPLEISAKHRTVKTPTRFKRFKNTLKRARNWVGEKLFGKRPTRTGLGTFKNYLGSKLFGKGKRTWLGRIKNRLEGRRRPEYV